MNPHSDNHLQNYQDLTRGDTVYVAQVEANAYHIHTLMVLYDDEILIAATADFSFDTSADWCEWEDSLIGRTPWEAVYKAVKRLLALSELGEYPEHAIPDYNDALTNASDHEPPRRNVPMVEPNVFLDAWCQAHECNLARLLEQAGISDVAYAEAIYRDTVPNED